jgi:hypothetical protein
MKVLRQAMAMFATFLILFAAQPASTQAGQQAKKGPEVQQPQTPVIPGALSDAVVRKAVVTANMLYAGDKWGVKAVDNAQAASTAGDTFMDHADEIGLWSKLDVELRANLETVSDYVLTDEDIAKHKERMKAPDLTVDEETARQSLEKLRDSREVIKGVLAAGGSRAVFVRLNENIHKIHDNLRASLNTRDMLRVALPAHPNLDNPCDVAETVVAAMAAACFFGCAPCCGAAVVGGIWVALCHLFVQK